LREFKETVIRALLPHIILSEANSRPIHGYMLIKQIRRKHGVYLGPSTIYPALADLEKNGLIRSDWVFTSPRNERPRKLYTITNKGKLLLDQTTTVLAFVNKTIEVKAS